MAGDPNLGTTKAALLSLDEAGADVIELGVPYSVSQAGFCVVLARVGALD